MKRNEVLSGAQLADLDVKFEGPSFGNNLDKILGEAPMRKKIFIFNLSSAPPHPRSLMVDTYGSVYLKQ